MPRYFFHLYNDDIIVDDEGLELADLTAAEVRGRDFARDMAAASITEHQHLCGGHRIDVADSSGEIVLSICFRDAVKINP
jgi:hypothetical protein